MTAVEYVKKNLRRDYGDQSVEIIHRFDIQLDEIMVAHGLTEGELNSRFQQLMDEMLYPFLACMRAIEGAGLPAGDSDAYCRKLWDDMPMEIKQMIPT